MKGNFFQAMQEQNKIARDHKPHMKEREKFVAVMNSYLGTMKHYKTYKFRKRTINRHLSAWWWNRVSMKGGMAKFVFRDK
jgi:truncated hemoglobin YjbI